MPLLEIQNLTAETLGHSFDIEVEHDEPLDDVLPTETYPNRRRLDDTASPTGKRKLDPLFIALDSGPLTNEYTLPPTTAFVAVLFIVNLLVAFVLIFPDVRIS